MKLVLVIPILTDGGAERVAAALLNQWCLLGHSCECVLTSPRQKASYALDPRVKVCYLSEERKISFLQKIRLLHREICHFGADFIISFSPTSHYLGVRAARGTSCLCVCAERNSPRFYPSSKVQRLIRRIAFEKCSLVVFQNEGAKSFFSSKIQKKAVVIPNPVPSSSQALPSFADRRDMVLFVGRLSPQKNIPFLLDAFSTFSKDHANFSLEIFGDGPLRDELIERANRLLCSSRIVFHPFSSHISEAYLSSKLLALTSHFEGTPNVVIEGLSFGVPVVALDCDPGGCRPYINDGQNGYLLPLDSSPDQFANAMSLAIKQGEGMSRKAFESSQSLKKFASIVKIAPKWIEAMEDVSKHETK